MTDNFWLNKKNLEKKYFADNEEYIKSKWLGDWNYDFGPSPFDKYPEKKFPSDAVLTVEFDAALYANKYIITYIYDGQKCFVKQYVSIQMVEHQGDKVIKLVLHKMIDYACHLHEWDDEQKEALIKSLNSISLPVSIENNYGGYVQGHVQGVMVPAQPMAGIKGKPISAWAKELPGINEWVRYPCKCATTQEAREKGHKARLHDVIIHLNDSCRWSIDKIASWIDGLADRGEINVDFPTPGLDGDDSPGYDG